VRNRKSHFGSKVKLERSVKTGRSAQRLWPRQGHSLASGLVSEHRKVSLLSVARKRKIHHAAKKKGQANTRSTRGKGNTKKKR
jgi:hypothetical protein